ncbi:MAG: hypothetical protein U5R31_15210 [Acidimicrobiia bacterium]|nr:hypothetical protein [Acidimicrobiia bacterium]
MSFIVPESLLAGSGHRDRSGAACGAWVGSTVSGAADERVFDAAVDVCAPVLVVGDAAVDAAVDAGGVRRAHGSRVEPLPSVPPPPSGSALVAPAAPAARARYGQTSGLRGRSATSAFATAGFRDQYYELRDAVPRGSPGPTSPVEEEMPLVTSGLIDPGVCRWGARVAALRPSTLGATGGGPGASRAHVPPRRRVGA